MHIISTLFTAQSVQDHLSTDEGRAEAARWCAEHGITKVYIESFRGLFIEQSLLEEARNFFEEAGFEVDGCVTTVELAKTANNDRYVGCYAHEPNHELMERIFRRTAAVFDTIMIDDFLFTTCDCDECKKAAGGRSLAQYHSDVLHEMSIKRILGPAREVNPNCTVIIKYPNWYDRYYRGGYDVVRQTEVFDQIWAGNETREPGSAKWGRYPQTMAAYIQQWDHKLSDEKCMGGWYDALTTLPPTYLEQARNTILGGARESMLFCYSLLHDEEQGLPDAAAFVSEVKGLHKLAYLISGKKAVGVSVPKKPNCDATEELFIAGMYGMLGIPFVADTELDCCAKAAILGMQAIDYEDIRSYTQCMIAAGKPVAFTQRFLDHTGLQAPSGAVVFNPQEDIWNIVNKPTEEEIDALRNKLLEPYGVEMLAKSRVGLMLFDDDMEILQNFNDEAVEVSLKLCGRNGKARKIVHTLCEDKEAVLSREGRAYTLTIPPRTLVVLY